MKTTINSISNQSLFNINNLKGSIMKTKLFLIVSMFAAGLFLMSFQSANEISNSSSADQAELTFNYLSLDKNKPDYLAISPRIINYPNPFYNVTLIQYKLPANTSVLLQVHELSTGKIFILFKGLQQKGSYSIKFDATHFQEGEYVAELITENYTAKRTMYKLNGFGGSGSIR